MKFEIFASRETEPDFVSKSIMKFTDADFSHVGILVDDELMYDATGKGIAEGKASEFLVDHLFVKKLDVSNLLLIPQERALGWLHGNCGKDYSESQYVGFLIPALKKFMGDDKKEMICSEFVIEFLKYVGALNGSVDADFVDPKQCMEIVEKLAA